jgi:hypothetical protein
MTNVLQVCRDIASRGSGQLWPHGSMSEKHHDAAHEVHCGRTDVEHDVLRTSVFGAASMPEASRQMSCDVRTRPVPLLGFNSLFLVDRLNDLE